MTAALRRQSRRIAAVVAVSAMALGLSACGGSEAPVDIAAGKQVFQTCQGCHALQDAGSKPGIGPNLDDSWRASREAGFEDSQFAGTIERWIKEAQLPMPRDLVTGQDARNVAAYIASVAGKTPESAAFDPAPTPEVPEPSRQDIK